MEALARVTPWATGVGEADGGSGDPSPVTAYGVLHAMRAVVRRLDGAPELAGRRVAVQGAGHVGAHLARLLLEAGARVTIADIRPERAEAVAASLVGVHAVAPHQVLELDCDILAPCALGAVLTYESVARLRCRAICGAANNQLAHDDVEDALVARDIAYVPDFVANAGGIINIAEEFTGYSRERALSRTASIFETVTRVFETADARALTPGRAAVELARERIEREGAGRRWRPGDPTAWTNGEPLRTLRPRARS